LTSRLYRLSYWLALSLGRAEARYSKGRIVQLRSTWCFIVTLSSRNATTTGDGTHRKTIIFGP
jgi:hypothetical protein